MIHLNGHVQFPVGAEGGESASWLRRRSRGARRGRCLGAAVLGLELGLVVGLRGCLREGRGLTLWR